MIAALYVATGGPYSNIKGIDAWDVNRDARLYKGPHRVIAHPPCERWGRYWGGGPMLHGTSKQKRMGDDDGCFAHALWSVRTFGGVIEHPEASHAWPWFGLTKPPRSGGWVQADNYGGWTCCVAQGHYGHRAQKFTWLYAVDTDRPDLIWGKCEGKVRLEEGFHSKEGARSARRAKEFRPRARITEEDRVHTPIKFRSLLMRITDEKSGVRNG